MKQRSHAKRRSALPNTQIATVEPTVLAQANRRLNDNDPRTHEELVFLASTVSSQAKRLDRAFTGVARLQQQVQNVSVQLETFADGSERIKSLETRFEVAGSQLKIEALSTDLKAAQKDLRDAVDALKVTQASQASDLRIIRYVLSTLAIFAVSGAGHVLGPEILKLILAALK